MSLFHFLFYYLASFKHPPWDTGISPPELLDFMQSHPVGRALDLGCGTGTNVITLAKIGWDATGVDFVQRSISQAKVKAARANVSDRCHFICRSVTKLDQLVPPYDLILDMGCYHGLTPSDRIIYHQLIDKCLAPQGTFLHYGMLTSDGASVGVGENDLLAFQEFLVLSRRTDSTDRGRSSTWWWFNRAV